MTYLWIFGGCYLAALAVLLTTFKRKNDIAAARLRENGASPENIRNFYREVNTKSVLPLAWATFFFGSIGGGLLSVVYWVVK